MPLKAAYLFSTMYSRSLCNRLLEGTISDIMQYIYMTQFFYFESVDMPWLVSELFKILRNLSNLIAW